MVVEGLRLHRGGVGKSSDLGNCVRFVHKFLLVPDA